MDTVKLTQYSHGAGCGCKIAPAVLNEIVRFSSQPEDDARLIVGNHSRDDAAVYDLGNGFTIISTTDFFMPIVDDPYHFGKIAATNAISDIYAMGGQPIMAISILGWPIDKLDSSVANKVIEGARSTCKEAGISLAGGHSIDNPEPLFGLAVTGQAPIGNIKKNKTAQPDDLIFLTKPLGTGVYTTAQKKGYLSEEHLRDVISVMSQLNRAGAIFGTKPYVHAMTDVTGFGLLGHLLEVCEGSELNAILYYNSLPLLEGLENYLSKNCVPGGTKRNFDSYGEKVVSLTDEQKNILCDPQTSGGLLVAVAPSKVNDFKALAQKENLELNPIGQFKKKVSDRILIDLD